MKKVKWATILLVLAATIFIYQNCAEKKLELAAQASNIPIPIHEDSEIKISAGHAFACLLNHGNAKCFGINAYGSVGNGTTANQSIPNQVSGMDSNVTDISAGTNVGCAVKSGAVYCWGYIISGGAFSSSDPITTAPRLIGGLESGVTRVTTNDYTACAIKAGALYCWGYNAVGQAGIGSTSGTATPTLVVGMENGVSNVSISHWNGRHACAIKNGALFCWGENNYFQLGDGTNANRTQPQPVVAMDANVTAVSVGTDFTCAIKNKQLYCWGRNGDGRLGVGDFTDRAGPARVLAFDGKIVEDVAAGSNHTCALVEKQVYCWGHNGTGAVGDGTTTNAATPIKVVGMEDVSQISCGGQAINPGSTSYAIKGNKIFAWGYNAYGQFGNGTTQSSLAPVESFSF